MKEHDESGTGSLQN